ncbi:uncharacterized protein [Paramormyrops kingsleyae]|uniref:uncharacterized protein isoform X1 n=2 Tax=Paramormyrops kingsleyae TaxID=1676925 RepID=UPI003B97A82A
MSCLAFTGGGRRLSRGRRWMCRCGLRTRLCNSIGAAGVSGECLPAMEQNAIQWLGTPYCLRGSFAFYKSFSHQAEAGLQPSVWSLGQFFFVRFGPQDPVCIAELTLLWEDQAQRHLLSSSRLYFLPEDTPKGRTGEHGEEEVLAVSKKMVIRLEDLVKWTCPESPGWKRNSLGDKRCNGTVPETHICVTSVMDGARNKSRSPVDRQCVKVLSYPQYCRFRSLRRRMQNAEGCTSLQDPHLLALGGTCLGHRNTWIFYCRDTFNHPALESSASFWMHQGFLSLSLKGRPRKRKSLDGKEAAYYSQSRSWIEAKENVMGGAEIPGEHRWLPRPEEQNFLDRLYLFMERRGSPISKVPKLGFKKVDLFLLFSVVKRLGGYERVTSQRLWKKVYNELGGNPGSTSAATCTRRHYEKLILPYEQQMKGSRSDKPQVLAAAGLAVDVTRGRGAQARLKVKKGASSEGEVKQRGTAASQRRGRPRGRSHTNAAVSAPPQKSPETHSSARELPPTVSQKHCTSSAPEVEGISSVDLKSSSSSAVVQGFAPQDSPLIQGLTPFPSGPPITTADPRVNMEPANWKYASPLPTSRLVHDNGSLSDIGLSKVSPLDHLKTRLGLNSSAVSAPQGPAVCPHSPAELFCLTNKAGESQNGLKWERLPGSPANDGTRKCHADCVTLDSFCKLPKPLKVLPLDIDCSLQVRHLMHMPPGSSQLSSFGKKLSEVLAQDLSDACQSPSPHPGLQEQMYPLNLSMRSASKKPAVDLRSEVFDTCQNTDDPPCEPKVNFKKESVKDSGLVPNTNGCLVLALAQETPTDLCLPRQAKELLHGHVTQQEGATCGPDPFEADVHPLLAVVKEDSTLGSCSNSCELPAQVNM